MIRVEGLAARVGAFTLENISFEVPAGGYAMILGPTGSGKTTLLDVLAGHVPALQGRVTLSGHDATFLPPEERGLGLVYQAHHLFPHLSVRDNIGYGLPAGRGRAGPREARVRELAAMLGIEALLGRAVTRLSGGERQRVALARALAGRPGILLLDEPFTAIDPAMRHALRRDLRQLHEREGITTLQVTHDFEDALRLGEQVVILHQGRIVQQGPPEQVFRYPASAFVARFVGIGNILPGAATPASGGPPPFAARFRSGPLEFDVVAERAGAMHAIIRPEDIMLSRAPAPSSARNRFAGRVERLERAGPVTYVYLDVGRPLVAAVTTESAGEMGLAPGDQVTATFKTMAVHLV